MTDVASPKPALAVARLPAVGGYALAMYSVRIAAVLKNLLLAWFLGPAQFGFVAAFLTFLTYSAYLDLGLFHAIYREIPMLRGAGEQRRIARVVDTAFGGSLVLGGTAAAALLLLSFLEAVNVAPGPWWLGLGLALAVLGQQFAGVPYNVALGEGRLGPLGRALTIAAAADLAASVGGGIAWGAAGAVALGSVGLFVQFVLVRGFLPVKPRFRWDLREAKRLAAVGIPIALIWFSNANFIAIDKVVALVGLGKASLGLYTLATAASGLVMVGPVAVATRFWPRILHRLGESPAARGAFSAAAAGAHAAATVAGSLLVVGLVAAPVLTHALLPEYESAVRAAQILLAGSALLASTFPLTAYLIGRGSQWRVVRVYALTSLVNIALDAVLLGLGFGITGIAAGSLVSYALFAVTIQATVAAFDATPGAFATLLRSCAPLALAALVGGGLSGLLYGLGLADELGPALGATLGAVVLVVPISLSHVRRMRVAAG